MKLFFGSVWSLLKIFPVLLLIVAQSAVLEARPKRSSSTTLAVASLPSAPSNLSVKAVSVSQINLQWSDNSSIESGYKVERRTELGTYSQIAQLSAGAVSYSSANLNSNTLYY